MTFDLFEIVETVKAYRQLIWGNGFRPVPVNTGQKYPQGRDALKWPEKARRNPPFACTYSDVDHLNTGMLCDGLRPFDVDLADPTKVQAAVNYLTENFGAAPIRYRENSPRVLVLYAAAEDEPPPKMQVRNRATDEAIEVLGRGQQFVCCGRHPSGAFYDWRGGSPKTVQQADLIRLTQQQVEQFLGFCGSVIGVEYIPKSAKVGREIRPEKSVLVTAAPAGSHAASLWCLGDVIDALAQMPHLNQDRQDWFEIACAIHTVTGGSLDGFEAFDVWSSGSPKYSHSACATLWQSLHGRADNKITGGTLTHRVMQANPNWVRPSKTFTPLRIKQRTI